MASAIGRRDIPNSVTTDFVGYVNNVWKSILAGNT
jgi:hypothetical protein